MNCKRLDNYIAIEKKKKKKLAGFISIDKHLVTDIIYLLIRPDLETCLLRKTASNFLVN